MTHRSAFPQVCRDWRQRRKLSQLELSLRADVSQRHVSWLERGKSQPSRSMVIRLSEAMDMPLRARNLMLQAAGFAPIYKESALDDTDMAPVLQAVTRILSHHDPFPSLVVDRFWNVLMQNDAATRMFGAVGDLQAMSQNLGSSNTVNLAFLTLHEAGLRRFITNFEQAAPAFLQRLRAESESSGDEERIEQYRALAKLVDPSMESSASAPLLPVLPLELDLHGVRLSLFSVISTLGTPQDVTTDEIRIESFYPNDDSTDTFFRGVT
ncbi:MAG: helix-turn-helix domain-containing protein [Pseudomonadota bacterium]